MNKQQEKFFNWGVSDAKCYPNDHPDQLLQEAWGFFLTEADDHVIDFPQLTNCFPFYKQGVLKTTRFYN